MIKRFIVVMSFVLGVLVMITWLLQEQGGKNHGHSCNENYFFVLLLLLLWATPFTLFRKPGKKKQ